MHTSMSFSKAQWAPQAPWLLPILLALIPGISTYITVYLEILPNILYPFFKLVLILLPFLIWKMQSSPLAIAMQGWWRFPTSRGLLSGLPMAAVILGCYTLFFQDMDSSGITAKLTRLDLLNHYLLAGLFISCINSALEEWFWRGFLQQQLTRLGIATVPLILGSGILFGIHHYFTLLPYCSTGLVLLFTSVTMVAGAIWSWQRVCGWSLVDCYVSHICCDLAIIYVGWQLIS